MRLILGSSDRCKCDDVPLIYISVQVVRLRFFIWRQFLVGFHIKARDVVV